jgi:hypothetical protein
MVIPLTMPILPRPNHKNKAHQHNRNKQNILVPVKTNLINKAAPPSATKVKRRKPMAPPPAPNLRSEPPTQVGREMVRIPKEVRESMEVREKRLDLEGVCL